jgi:hypothetical protein
MGYDDTTSKILVYHFENKSKVLIDGFHRTEANRDNKIMAPDHYKKNVNCVFISSGIYFDILIKYFYLIHLDAPVDEVIELSIKLNSNAETVAVSTIGDKFSYFLKTKELFLRKLETSSNQKPATRQNSKAVSSVSKFVFSVKK